MSKSPITCHVLDSTTGKPADQVLVELHQMDGMDSNILARGETDRDGRCSTLLDPSTKLKAGIYKMIFHTGEYFEAFSPPKSSFYPHVEIIFNYEPSTHHHIPLLLSQYSYTTYRGS